MVFSVGGELLTSTVSIVKRWREYFEVLLNPTNMHSEEEAEAEDFGLGALGVGWISCVTGHSISVLLKPELGFHCQE